MTAYERRRRQPTYLLTKNVSDFLPERDAALAVATKVGFQFPDTAEGRLMRSVFVTSVNDLFLKDHRRSACQHLQGRIFEAEVCGIDADWIRKQLRDAGVTIEDFE